MRFELRYPNAHHVCVAGTFNGWQPETRLLPEADDRWAVELELAPGTYEYRFVVDGQWIEDPAAPAQSINPYGGRNSVLTV